MHVHTPLSLHTHTSFSLLPPPSPVSGRYLFLNAIANQLHYPNSHTHYFSCALLSLFAETNAEAIQEQITRVLLEQLIVNRPHPWGLLITFIELIKNPTYNFWKQSSYTVLLRSKSKYLPQLPEIFIVKIS